MGHSISKQILLKIEAWLFRNRQQILRGFIGFSVLISFIPTPVKAQAPVQFVPPLLPVTCKLFLQVQCSAVVAQLPTSDWLSAENAAQAQQAAAENAKLAAAQAAQTANTPVITKVVQSSVPTKINEISSSGTVNKDQIMAQAGIPQSDWADTDYIISRESGWNPNATEPHSGAHGLPQALPYSKTACGWTDSLCQLKWFQNYCISRYGSIHQAKLYWVIHHNY